MNAARRRLRASEHRQPVTHIALPGLEIARAVPRSRETVTAFLRRTGWARRDPQYGWQFKNGLPTILQVNGEPVLRKRWRATAEDIDPIIGGAAMLETKRAQDGRYFVGCFGQVTTVYNGRIEQRIIARWPDDIIGTKLGSVPVPA